MKWIRCLVTKPKGVLAIVQSFLKWIMENTQGHEFPSFLSWGNDLESVEEKYFSARLAEEEVKEDEDFSDNSSDDETGFDIDFEFS